jgi:hypothetical protein
VPIPTTSTNAEPIPTTSTNSEPIPTTSTNSEPIPTTSTNAEPIPTTSTNAQPIPTTSTDGVPIPATSDQPREIAVTKELIENIFSSMSPPADKEEAGKRINIRKRKYQKSEMITSSPYKRMLEDRAALKLNNNQAKQTDRRNLPKGKGKRLDKSKKGLRNLRDKPSANEIRRALTAKESIQKLAKMSGGSNVTYAKIGHMNYAAISTQT